MAATSSGDSKRCRSEVGRSVLKNCSSTPGGDSVLSGAPCKHRDEPFRSGRPRQDRVHRDIGSDGGFRESAGEGYLHGFGNAVMDHGRWNVYRGFTGDEEDAAPSGLFHDGQVMAGKAHATHEVRSITARQSSSVRSSNGFGL